MSGYEDLTNLMKREAGRNDTHRKFILNGIIDSFESGSHSAKVILQPEGTITGWLPINTIGAGPMSVVFGPSKGDACTVAFVDGDINSGEIIGFQHNDTKRSPGVQSGEGIIQGPGGSQVYFDKNGNVVVKGSGGGKTSHNADGSITHTDSSGGVVHQAGGLVYLGSKTASNFVMLDSGPSTRIKGV